MAFIETPLNFNSPPLLAADIQALDSNYPYVQEEDLMPQPLVEGYQLNYRPRLLAERPEHAIGIALVASEWAALEEHLISAFTFCLFAFQGESHTSGKIARTAWEQVDSLKARLDLLDAIAKQRMPPDLLEQFKKTIRSEIRGRATERNRVVHGHWSVTDKYPKDIILDAPDPNDRRRYSVQDFEDIASRIIATSNLVGTFFHLTVANRIRPQSEH